MNKKLILIIAVFSFIVTLISFVISSVMVKNSAYKARVRAGQNIVYDFGLKLYEEGKIDKAAKAFKIIAEKESDPIKKETAFLKLAQIYTKKKDLLKAREYLRRMIEEFPGSKNIAESQKQLEGVDMKILFSSLPSEDSVSYEIKPNDTLGGIAKRFNTTVELLKKSNNLKNDIIYPGKTLKIAKSAFTILVDKSQNLLFLKKNGEIIKTYAVSTGENNSTPVGLFKIEEKMEKPLWYKVGAVVRPDSPEYELGSRWMGISKGGYGIHGTNDQSSIGKQVTKGCIRMSNEDIEELCAIVPSGTDVEIVN